MGTDIQLLLQELEQVQQDPTRFFSYADDPVGFARDVLGIDLWEKQRDIMQAVRDHRRVAVRSGHGIGKSFVSSAVVLWWLYARQGLVVTTAPTKSHVEDVLWQEIAHMVRMAPVKLPGEQLGTEHKIDTQWYAIGLTTSMPGAFQGRHHPRLLVVVDEAPGVPELIHLELSTLATGASNHILMIGNPTTLSGTFYDAFKSPDVWHCIRASCLDHPNVVLGKEVIPGAVTTQWVDERLRLWGDQHPFWFSRVIGEFPRISTRGVIPLGWCERAVNEDARLRAIQEAEHDRVPRMGGLDVARYGENKSVLTIRRGDAIEFQESWHHASITETCGRGMQAIRDYGLKTLVIDASGVGAGVYDRLLELRAPVYGYNGGHRAFTPGSFSNRRSEMWWAMRTRLEKQRLWFPAQSEKLIAELVVPEYELTSSGRIKVETKENLLDRGVKSPDHADSLILCFAMDENPEADLSPKEEDRSRDPEVFKPRDEDDTFAQLGAGF